MDREIEKVKKEYEEKQRKKREKEKEKDKEKDGEKADDKKKAEEEEESKKDEKEKDDKVCGPAPFSSLPHGSRTTPNLRNNRSNLYRMQLALWMLARMTCLEYTHSTSMCDVKRPLDVCITTSYILTASAGTSTKCGLID